MRASVATLLLTGLAATAIACSSDPHELKAALPASMPSAVEAAAALDATVPAKTEAAQAAVDTAASCPAGMARIAGGKLSTLERGHPVQVAGFCLDVAEVTVSAFRAAVDGGAVHRECAAKPGVGATSAACPSVPARTDWNDVNEDAVSSRFCNGDKSGRDDHPVNCVSIGEAESYCAARGARLPTGDEWEWAARGTRPSPWGTMVAHDEICWGKPKKRGGTCASGAMPADLTADGVRDLGGNLTEWTTPPERNGKAHAHWAYGASWYAVDDGYARAALGGVEMPAKRAETVGFRCAAAPS